MTFTEAKYHARHNMNSKHKFVTVTDDGNIHLSDEALTIKGHVVKADGEPVKESAEETESTPTKGKK